MTWKSTKSEMSLKLDKKNPEKHFLNIFLYAFTVLSYRVIGYVDLWICGLSSENSKFPVMAIKVWQKMDLRVLFFSFENMAHVLNWSQTPMDDLSINSLSWREVKAQNLHVWNLVKMVISWKCPRLASNSHVMTVLYNLSWIKVEECKIVMSENFVWKCYTTLIFYHMIKRV